MDNTRGMLQHACAIFRGSQEERIAPAVQHRQQTPSYGLPAIPRCTHSWFRLRAIRLQSPGGQSDYCLGREEGETEEEEASTKREGGMQNMRMKHETVFSFFVFSRPTASPKSIFPVRIQYTQDPQDPG